LVWDAARSRLVIADEANSRILAWQGGAVSVVADVPVAEGKAGLGQPVLDAGGNIVVPRFGYGISGAVIKVDAEGHVSSIAGVDPKRRRIGLAPHQGRLFETFFVKADDHREGGLAEVQANGSEVDLATFHKPVGVVAAGDAIYVSDQDD